MKRLSPDRHVPLTGLVLTGGGARAAYQVGVLKAIAQIRRDAGAAQRGNPFPVIAGTSAGAINAAALACQADDFDRGGRRHRRGLGELPRRAGLPRRFDRRDPHRRALADDDVDRLGDRALAPRAAALAARQHAARGAARQAGRTERLHAGDARAATCRRSRSRPRATARACTSPSTTRSTTSCPWTRSQRIAVRAAITIAAPAGVVGDPVRVSGGARCDIDGSHEYFGDGSMRQAAPISPAVHLGAERILVVGAGRMHEPPGERARQQRLPEPGADRRPRAVEHLPRCARGRRGAAAAHQPHAGAAAAARRAPTPA